MKDRSSPIHLPEKSFRTLPFPSFRSGGEEVGSVSTPELVTLLLALPSDLANALCFGSAGYHQALTRGGDGAGVNTCLFFSLVA